MRGTCDAHVGSETEHVGHVGHVGRVGGLEAITGARLGVSEDVEQPYQSASCL